MVVQDVDASLWTFLGLDDAFSFITKPIEYGLYCCCALIVIFFLAHIFIMCKTNSDKHLERLTNLKTSIKERKWKQILTLGLLSSQVPASQAQIVMFDRMRVPVYSELVNYTINVVSSDVLNHASMLFDAIQKYNVSDANSHFAGIKLDNPCLNPLMFATLENVGSNLILATGMLSYNLIDHTGDKLRTENGVIFGAAGNTGISALTLNGISKHLSCHANDSMGRIFFNNMKSKINPRNFELMMSLNNKIDRLCFTNEPKIIEFMKTTIKMFCTTPNVTVEFSDGSVILDYNTIIYDLIVHQMEFQESLSECKSYDCFVGFQSLYLNYKELSDKTSLPSRSKRSVRDIAEAICRIIKIGQSEKSINECIMDGGVTADILKNSLTRLEDSLNVRFQETVKEMTNLQDQISEIKISLMKWSHQVDLALTGTQRSLQILEQNMMTYREMDLIRSQINNHIVGLMSRTRFWYKELQNRLFLPIWSHSCVFKRDCTQLNDFLSSHVLYWKQLMHHNFDPRIKMISHDSTILSFLSPKSITYKTLNLPYLPKIDIRRHCAPNSEGIFKCEKCFNQPFTMLTINFNGTNHYESKVHPRTMMTYNLTWTSPCYSDHGNSDVYVTVAQNCYQIFDTSLTRVEHSHCTSPGITHLPVHNIHTDMQFPKFSAHIIKIANLSESMNMYDDYFNSSHFNFSSEVHIKSYISAITAEHASSLDAIRSIKAPMKQTTDAVSVVSVIFFITNMLLTSLVACFVYYKFKKLEPKKPSELEQIISEVDNKDDDLVSGLTNKILHQPKSSKIINRTSNYDVTASAPEEIEMVQLYPSLPMECAMKVHLSDGKEKTFYRSSFKHFVFEGHQVTILPESPGGKVITVTDVVDVDWIVPDQGN